MPAARKPASPDRPHVALRPVTVENPYFSRAHSADKSNPATIPAVVNLRESAITLLAARGKLDPAQVAAATRFRALWEASGLFDYGQGRCGRWAAA